MASDRTHAAKNRRGFTLLEVMIAVSILSIGFFAVYSLFLQSVAASEEARFRQQAAFLATLKEPGWSKEPPRATGDEGDFGEAYPGWHWRTTPSPVVNQEFDAVVKRLNRVRLEVFQDGGDRTYSVTHYCLVTETP